MRYLLQQKNYKQHSHNSQNDASDWKRWFNNQKQARIFKNYGDVWFDERSITNILCLKNTKKKYRVTYDSAKNGTFTVHKPDAQLHFVMHQDGLHYHDTKNREVTLIQTVQENEEGCSKRQIKYAQEARDLYSKVGYPSP